MATIKMNEWCVASSSIKHRVCIMIALSRLWNDMKVTSVRLWLHPAWGEGEGRRDRGTGFPMF